MKYIRQCRLPSSGHFVQTLVRGYNTKAVPYRLLQLTDTTYFHINQQLECRGSCSIHHTLLERPWMHTKSTEIKRHDGTADNIHTVIYEMVTHIYHDIYGFHNDVITWICFLYCWPFVGETSIGLHVDSPHERPVMLSLCWDLCLNILWNEQLYQRGFERNDTCVTSLWYCPSFFIKRNVNVNYSLKWCKWKKLPYKLVSYSE